MLIASQMFINRKKCGVAFNGITNIKHVSSSDSEKAYHRCAHVNWPLRERK